MSNAKPEQMNAAAPDSQLSAAVAVLAAGALGIGLTPLNPDVGTFTVLIVVIALLLGVLVPTGRAVREKGLLVPTMAAVVVFEGFILASLPRVDNLAYQALLIAITVGSAHCIVSSWRWRLVEVGLLIAAFFGAMCWMLAATDAPPVDVILFQNDGAAALLRGQNPFAIQYENIYYGLDSGYYAPELEVGNQLDFGFIYPPLSLLLAVPGYVLTGDYRYGAVAAMTLTAVLIVLGRRDSIGIGAAILVLLAPVTQLVLFGGWTEPFVLLLLASVFLAATRSPRAAPVALGLLIASKQYLAPVLGLAVVLLRDVRHKNGAARMVLIAIGVALITVVPFALWDLSSLIHSTIGVHLIQPVRRDGISIAGLLLRSGLQPPNPLIGFAVAGIVGGALVLLVRQSSVGFFYATAIGFAVFFLFSKQAFAHYYLFVLVALACGVAAGNYRTGSYRDPVRGPERCAASHAGNILRPLRRCRGQSHPSVPSAEPE